MISNDELCELNNYMLGLGQPIDRDDVGYNVPDFYRMNGLAYIPPSEYTPLMCFAMLDTLRHYNNTQLTHKSAEIEETYAYYDRTLTLAEKNLFNNDHTYFKNANYDFLPPELRKERNYLNFVKTYTSSQDIDYIVMTFENSRKANSYKNQIQTEDAENDLGYKRCYFRNLGSWDNPEFQFYIVPELLPQFVRLMDYKYTPDDELKKILAEMDLGKFKVEHEDIPVQIIGYEESTDMYELFTDKYIAPLKDFVYNNKPLVRWQKADNGQFHIVVSGDKMQEYLDIMDSVKHCDTKEIHALFEQNENKKKNSIVKPINVQLERYRLLDGTDSFGISFDLNMKVLEYIQQTKPFKDYPSMKNRIEMALTNKELRHLRETIDKMSENLGLTFDMDMDLQTEIDRANAQFMSEYPIADFDKLHLPVTLYDYQKEDIIEISKSARKLIGHDMGCGKTLMATIVGNNIDKPKLVIVPESLRLNWEKEIKKMLPDADVKVLYSKDDFETAKDWTIVGYSTATKFEKELLASKFDVVFVDEAHKCKAIDNKGNPKSNRAKAVLNITDKAKYCYLLTGTPIPTSNRDLFNILKMLKVDDIDFEKKFAFFDYGREYCHGYNNGFGWDFTGNSNSDKLHEILAPNMVRRLKKDVLPNLIKQRNFVPINISNSAIRDIENRMEDLRDDDTFMGLAMTGRRLMSANKVNDIAELCNTMLEAEESVVLVSQFDETIDKLKEIYKDDCCVIKGGMSDKTKEQAKEDFQSGLKKVCIVNTIAGGVGLTLTKASNMIIADFDWTPSNMSQVEDRICRIGQENPCNIYYMYGEDCILDSYFVDMITDKNGNIDLVVDKTENGMDLRNDKNENSNFLDYLKKRLQFRVPCNIEPVEKADKTKIAKLSKINHLDTFDKDVANLTKSVKTDKTKAEWQRLIDLRREELVQYYDSQKEEVIVDVPEK